MDKILFRTVWRPPPSAQPRGMLRERIAVVRKLFDAWRNGRLEVVENLVDPAVEVDWSESRAPYRGVYEGHAGWVVLFDEIRRAFEEVALEPHDFVSTGQDVAVPTTVRMRGRDGIEVVARSTLVFTFLGVKVVALRLA